MAKITVSITIELVKPDISGVDVDAAIQWIKTNIADKLPANATHTYVMHITP